MGMLELYSIKHPIKSLSKQEATFNIGRYSMDFDWIVLSSSMQYLKNANNKTHLLQTLFPSKKIYMHTFQNKMLSRMYTYVMA